MQDDLSDYFLRATGARSVRAMATETGIEQTTLNRQLKGSVAVETVVALCRAYDLDIADTFVAVGFITDAEADKLGARIGIGIFTDLELAREIVRRIEAGEAGEALTGDLPATDVRDERQDDYEAVASERDGEDETDEGFN